MASVFISYRRNDNPDAAGRICDRLSDHFGKESVYFDIDSNAVGRDFREDIQKAVGECEVLAVIIGDNWLKKDDQGRTRLEKPTDFVRIEVETALDRDIPVIPVLVGNATIPEENDLPEELKKLAYRHAVEIRAGVSFQGHVERLITGVESIFAENKPQPADPPSEDRAKVEEDVAVQLEKAPAADTTHQEVPSLLWITSMANISYAFFVIFARTSFVPELKSVFIAWFFVIALLAIGLVAHYLGKLSAAATSVTAAFTQLPPFALNLNLYINLGVNLGEGLLSLALEFGIPFTVFGLLAIFYWKKESSRQ